MNNYSVRVKRALLSVSDKTGIVEFAQALSAAGVEIVSTGGTSKLLKEAGIKHLQVEDLTKLPEMMDGRVKTLHPKIHAGILGRRDTHQAEADQHQIGWIDLVVVNFYPFGTSVNADTPCEKAVEYIDIGGPTMVRAAAKNFAWVGVVVDPVDYAQVLKEMTEQQGLTFATRKQLAGKVFAVTAQYDAMVRDYFNPAADQLDLTLNKVLELRYGENPHQQAAAYQLNAEKTGVLGAVIRQGKALSYNNMLDAEAAWNSVQEFSEPACVIVKHANPCGAASADTIETAYALAYQADPQSAFGGIIALNRPCTKEIALAITQFFVEVLLAPAYTEEALAVLAVKPNLRVLEMPKHDIPEWELKFITGGVLRQQKDAQRLHLDQLKIVTEAKPSDADVQTMMFAWQVLKHIKSNGILIAKNQATVGIGAGQVSRIDAVDIAVRKAGAQIDGSILASDAFFPFRDSIDRLAKTGVRAIIQPGGSVRDEEVIAACNEYGIAMVFTGKRCFRH